MDTKAIPKAESRLRVTKKAIKDLEVCQSFDDFMDIWYTFLVAAKNVYTILEQGSKMSPQSRQWFGGVKRERHNDPLLQYVFQARNDDEHGLSFGAEHVPGSLAIGVAKEGFSNAMRIDGMIGPGGTLTVESLDGKPVLIEQTSPHARLIRVHGRSGEPYDPPTIHKGQELKDQSPLNVARLTAAHLENLILEARQKT